MNSISELGPAMETTRESPAAAAIPAPSGESQAPAGARERELIRRAGEGNEEAFAALFEMHRQRVYRLCLRMTNDRAEAEDLCQEAFLQLFRKIRGFRGESAFSTWLHRLVVNTVLMSLRRKVVREIPLEESRTDGEDGAKREYGAGDPHLAASVDRLHLARAIGKLPHGYRTVFVLHDIEGYEHSEIARLLNRSIGNCKSRLHKARLRLRQLLRPPARPATGCG
jgi:RNA polymerase sigma-70 factor (ECF subfamily)